MSSNSQASFLCPWSVHGSSYDNELVLFEINGIATFLLLGVNNQNGHS
jgi:hypothetical protein